MEGPRALSSGRGGPVLILLLAFTGHSAAEALTPQLLQLPS